MVHGCAQIFVLACELLMVLLLIGGRDMLLVRGLKFSLSGLSLQAAISVIAYIGRMIINHLLVVDVIDNRGIADIGDGPVMVERSAGPVASREAYPCIAKSVAHAAVKTDGRPPIAGVPSI